MTDTINNNLLDEIHMLEIEKNKLRLEIGNLLSVMIPENHDVSTVCEPLSLL